MDDETRHVSNGTKSKATRMSTGLNATRVGPTDTWPIKGLKGMNLHFKVNELLEEIYTTVLLFTLGTYETGFAK